MDGALKLGIGHGLSVGILVDATFIHDHFLAIRKQVSWLALGTYQLSGRCGVVALPFVSAAALTIVEGGEDGGAHVTAWLVMLGAGTHPLH